MSAQTANAFSDLNTAKLEDLAHRTLILGDIQRWQAAGRDIAAFEHFKFIELSEMSADLLSEFKPELILSPLLGDAFDVFEVAQALHRFGFEGRYRALCTNVPNIDIIRSDVVQIAPDLDFDLLQVPPAGPKIASDNG